MRSFQGQSCLRTFVEKVLVFSSLAAVLLHLTALPARAHSGRVALARPLQDIVIDGDLTDWPADLERYPILLPDRLVLLLNLAGGAAHQVVVNVDRAALDATAHRLRRGLQNRTDDRFLIEARQLYDWLIRPVEKILQAAGVDTLVWVPDGSLRTIPVSTVQDGERFLGAGHGDVAHIASF